MALALKGLMSTVGEGVIFYDKLSIKMQFTKKGISPLKIFPSKTP